jgi:hypothetical protein
MLYREDGGDLIVITQPTHAWVSGQLARAWGNAQFGGFEPREDVCLGAEQHDLGWLAWEQSPTLHPRTARPRRFFEMTTGAHVGIWRGASRRALVVGRYAALLVSLHITNLYARHDYSQDTPEEAQAARDFLADERELQRELLASLAADARYAPHASPEVTGRNQRLVAVWDRLSLALCGGVRDGLTIDDVPTATGSIALALASPGGEPTRVVVSPWPFQRDTETVCFDVRRLPGSPFASEEALHHALAQAPWQTIEIELVQQ